MNVIEQAIKYKTKLEKRNRIINTERMGKTKLQIKEWKTNDFKSLTKIKIRILTYLQLCSRAVQTFTFLRIYQSIHSIH